MKKLTPISRTQQVNRDVCLKRAGGNQYEMILMVSARAREMAREANKKNEYDVHMILPAMMELQEGKFGREYLKKLREKK